jgi:hypothetical protein
MQVHSNNLCGRFGSRLPAVATILVVGITTCGLSRAQTVESLAQVKRIYVESFGQENGAEKLRDRTVERLREGHQLEVVAAANQADAVLKGNGSIWVAGYVSNSPRAGANVHHAVFHGFLSVEVIGKNSQPLWSYLVTPSKFSTGDITNDLAGHLVAKLAGALRMKGESAGRRRRELPQN